MEWFLCLNTVPDTSGSVVSLYKQYPVSVSVCSTAGMSIPIQFHRLHPSVLPVYRSGRYGSSRYVVPDYRFCLSVPAVHSCLRQYTDTGSAVYLHCFPEPSAARPTGRWCGCMVCRHGLAGVFRSAGRGHRRHSHNDVYCLVLLLNFY